MVVRVGANQPVHYLLGGKGLGIQQGTSAWIGSPKYGCEVPTNLYCEYSIMKNNLATFYLTRDHFRDMTQTNIGIQLGFH